MRITIFILLASILQTFANDAYSQKTRLSLDVANQKLVDVFDEIENLSEFYFLYNEKLIDTHREVSISSKNEKINEILKELFAGTDVVYTITDRKIILAPSFLSESEAQQRTVSGKVTDSGGQPLPGVTVVVKGTTRGTVTNADGDYTLAISDGTETLQFSFIGMRTQEVIVGSQTSINITMAVDAIGLEEVVAVGYGVQKKVNLTGAISTVKANELESTPTTNVSSLLQGRMAGVTVTVNNSQPGKDQATIRIRGIGTLGNSNPMIVVDGVVSSSSLDNMNPDDIESISVLKDAASSAIYGSRAANGVILVTTKKGKEDVTIHYNMSYGLQNPIALPKYVDSWQQATLFNEAMKNEGKAQPFSEEEIQKFKNGSDPDNYPNTDWLGLFYKSNSPQQNHHIDVSGGSENIQSYASFAYFSQDGIIDNTELNRYNSRFQINAKLGSRIKLNGNLSYTVKDFKEPVSPYNNNFSDYIWQINRTGRILPNKYSNGYYGYHDDGNPMAWLESGAVTNENDHYFTGIANGDLEIFQGLHFKPLFSYESGDTFTKSFAKSIQYYNHQTGEPTFLQGPNKSTNRAYYNTKVTLQALLEYEKVLGKHAFKVISGYSQEYFNNRSLRGYRFNYLNNELSELDAGPIDGQQASGSSSELALQSLFGRINYIFSDRYLIEANLRNDGSSRFIPENRWSLYPSFSVGWRISEETFFAPLKNVFTDLKIRGSWGQLGNQEITGYYPYQTTVSPQNYTFGGSMATGVGPTSGANSDIKWETTESTNIGLDAIFINGQITFTADYFIRNTNDILLNLPVSRVFGLNAPVVNAGSVKNEGIELNLGYNTTRIKDFNFDINVNASYIKNEVTNLADAGPFISGSTFIDVGYPINSFYGYEAEGFFQTQEEVDKHATQSGGIIAPGDIKYKDTNGDGRITGADRKYLGTYFPTLTYALNTAVDWKGFDLIMFWQGDGGVKNFIQDEIKGLLRLNQGKATTIFLDHWTPDNRDANYPRLTSSYTNNEPSTYPSSFWVRDASYFRLKNIQIGYTLPNKWTSKVGVQNARIYWSAKDIITFTKFFDWVDPEAPAGERGYTYPKVKTHSVGINVTF